MNRDPRSTGAVVAGLFLLPFALAFLFLGALVVIAAVVAGAFRTYAPRPRRVTREVQVADVFASIAESTPDLHGAARDLDGLYLIPDHAQEV